jgi:hypothetical protein
MLTVKTMERTLTSADKLHIIRETFSTHVVIVYFGTQGGDYLNVIARDNLCELVNRAKQLVCSREYATLIAQVAGLSID